RDSLLDQHSEDFPDHQRFGSMDHILTAFAFRFTSIAISVRNPGSLYDESRAGFFQSSAMRAVFNFFLLIFRKHSFQLKKHPAFGIGVKRRGDEFEADAGAFQFVREYKLVAEATRQA